MKKINILKIIKKAKFKNLKKTILDLNFSYNGVNDFFIFNEEVKHKKNLIIITGTVSLSVNGKKINNQNTPDEFIYKNINVLADIKDVTVFDNGALVVSDFYNTDKAIFFIESLIKELF